MKKFTLMIFTMIITHLAMCQKKDTVNTDPFITAVHLSQSFQTPEQQLNPAIVQLSIPGTGRNNWLVDAGLSLTLGQLSKGSFTSKLIGEFHRNTLVDSQQYNYQVGYNFSIQNQHPKHNTVFVWTGNIKYVRDVVDTTHSIATSINIALYRSGRNMTCLGRPAYTTGYKYTYQLNPNFETQYQQILASDKNKAGAIVRPLVDLAGSIALNKPMDTTKTSLPPKLIELSLDYANRYAVVNATHNGEGYTKLLKAGLSYYFFSTPTSSASIGASYNLGSDPLNGLKDQRFWLIALQVQF